MAQQEPLQSALTCSSVLARAAFRLGALLDRVQVPGEVVVVVTSLLVGIGTGLGAIVFNRLIDAVSWVSFEWLPRLLAGPVPWMVVIAPTIGGLIAGPLIFYFAREAKGHGVPEVMEAIALKGGRIRPIVVVIKAVASSLTIGTGGSVGREGPIVQIGAALGSTLGQILHLSEERIRNLVACGAAGGIAATFNAPVAGVIFALEVILGELSIGHVGTVVLSAVTASTVMQALVGAEYTFAIPEPYTIESIWEFGFYAILGLAAALVAVAFVRTLYWAEDVFANQKLIPEAVQPAIGGLLMGLVALSYPFLFPALRYENIPQVFGGGYGPITAALSNHELLGTALVLIVLKMIATNLTLGSGGSGGIFAPSLFMGAMAGSAIGIVVNRLFPGIPAPPGAYALVGMGAVFAGAAQAPITAVIMLFELTGDYRIILPLMLTVVIAVLVSRQLLDGESIYTLKLTRRGIHLQSGRDVDILQGVLVGEVMTRDVDTVPVDMTIVELSEVFSRTRHHGFPVLDKDGKLWGIVTITDLERAVDQNMPRRTTVAEIATPREQMLVAYPDEPVGVVLARLSTRGLGRMPVVSREDPDKLVGLIRRSDIIRAYNVALARRAEIQHRARRMQLRNLDGLEFIEVTLSESDKAVGRTLQDIAPEMPADCVLISIRRDGTVVVPHGNTVFQPGDHITAFVRTSEKPQLYQCLKGEQPDTEQ